MAEGDSTKRSRLDADNVTNILREQGVANLRAYAPGGCPRAVNQAIHQPRIIFSLFTPDQAHLLVSPLA